MGGNHIHGLPLLLAGVLAALALWLNQLTQRPQWVAPDALAQQPDTIVQQFSAVAFDAQGRPAHRLSAERLVHYLDDATTHLTAPRFELLDANAVRLVVSAQRGQISTDGQHVHLIGQVRATRHVPGQPAPSRLATEYLWLTPDSGEMRTNQAITLSHDGATIHAGGMLANMQGNELHLFGRVRGVYE